MSPSTKTRATAAATLAATAITLLLLMLALTGCEAVAGLGRDLSRSADWVNLRLRDGFQDGRDVDN